MKAIIGEPKKLHFRNSYEGGFQGPCTAELIETVVEPSELGVVQNGEFVGNQEGTGKITSTFIYADGSSNTASISVTVIKPEVSEVVKEVQVTPKLLGGSIFDPDE